MVGNPYSNRNQHIGVARCEKVRGQNSYDSESASIEHDGSAKNAGVSGKAALPQRVAQNRNRRCAHLFFCCLKVTSNRRTDAYHREKVWRDREAAKGFRLG